MLGELLKPQQRTTKIGESRDWSPFTSRLFCSGSSKREGIKTFKIAPMHKPLRPPRSNSVFACEGPVSAQFCESNRRSHGGETGGRREPTNFISSHTKNRDKSSGGHPPTSFNPGREGEACLDDVEIISMRPRAGLDYQGWRSSIQALCHLRRRRGMSNFSSSLLLPPPIIIFVIWVMGHPSSHLSLPPFSPSLLQCRALESPSGPKI